MTVEAVFLVFMLVAVSTTVLVTKSVNVVVALAYWVTDEIMTAVIV